MGATSDLLKAVTKPYRNRLVTKAINEGLPSQLEPALRYLATEVVPEASRHAVERVEKVRAEMAARPGTVDVFYSPKPNTAGEDASEDARPGAGEQLAFTFEQIALKTSTPQRWGVFLKLVAEAASASSVIELGSCAGIAAAYLASAQQRPEVMTVEASPGLADLARSTASVVSDRVTVRDGFFDDALDDIIVSGSESRFDVAWIDGHHERVATQHYFRRLIPTLTPGAIVLFDDTNWSQDMRDGWEVLAAWPGFSHTVDLGKLGLGIWQGGDVVPRQWDLRRIAVSSRKVATPHGWSS